MSAGEIMLRSRRGHWKKVFATDAVTESFAALNEQAAEPAETTAGVIKVDPLCSGYVSTQVKILPYGTDAANEVFNGRLVAWHQNKAEGTWVPTELLTFAATLGTGAVLAGGSRLFADTITLSSGLTSDTTVVSTADDTRAWLLVDIMGAEYIQFQVDIVTATAGNYYYQTL